MASLDKEQADLEKALATSADEHAKLVAAKQAQELLLVEHLSHINIASDSRGGWIAYPLDRDTGYLLLSQAQNQ